MNQSQRREIGYFNTSTKEVIPGFSVAYHALSSTASELDSEGKVDFVESVNGQQTKMRADIKGQLVLDRQRRGGERLWVRIYDEADLVEKMEKKGVQVSKDKPIQTIEQRFNNPHTQTVKSETKEPEQASGVSEGETELTFGSVVKDEDFDA